LINLNATVVALLPLELRGNSHRKELRPTAMDVERREVLQTPRKSTAPPPEGRKPAVD